MRCTTNTYTSKRSLWTNRIEQANTLSGTASTGNKASAAALPGRESGAQDRAVQFLSKVHNCSRGEGGSENRFVSPQNFWTFPDPDPSSVRSDLNPRAVLDWGNIDAISIQSEKFVDLLF